MNDNNSITGLAGKPFPSKRGYVIGGCGHPITRQAWQAGRRTCEQCQKKADDSKKAEDYLLTPSEVGALFRVDAKTVTRWAQKGKLTSVRTLGGHRRYHADEVRALLNGSLTARTTGAQQ